MPIESDQWKLTFDELVETVEHHVRDEENELFPLSKKVLSDSQIQDIERRFKAVHESEMRLLQAQ
jgi:hemerythrin-like domain-containing protein